MPSLNVTLENAIAAIQCFLIDSGHGLPGEQSIRSLTERIEQTQASRKDHFPRPTDELTWSLTCAYRQQLERLHLRLCDLEPLLIAERERCCESQEDVSRTRAWHELVSRTQ